MEFDEYLEMKWILSTYMLAVIVFQIIFKANGLGYSVLGVCVGTSLQELFA